jgi:hypothetical protein
MSSTDGQEFPDGRAMWPTLRHANAGALWRWKNPATVIVASWIEKCSGRHQRV